MMKQSSRPTEKSRRASSRASPQGTSTIPSPELLEIILLHLDIRSLLTSAMGVCRQWRDLIRTSPPLRRALYFDADTKTADEENPKYNPLLVELFRPLFDFRVMPPKRQGFDDLAIEALPVGRRTRAFYRRNASWRRMHVRQPPVEYLGVWRWSTGMIWSCTMGMVRYPAGLRMERLYFWALRYSYDWQDSCFLSWTHEQKQQLWQFDGLKQLREASEKMVRTADVIVKANFGGDCMCEFDERKKPDKDGLVTIGGRWFKLKEENDEEALWDEEDHDFWD